MKKFFLLILLMSCIGTLKAQGPQYSQFYAAPAMLNPALVGNGQAPRLMVNFRNQWASIGNDFNTGTVAFDSYNEDKSIGWGVLGVHDQRGQALQSNMLAGQFSKKTYISADRQFRLIGGAQAAWVSNRWNADQLVYVSDLLGTADPLAQTGLSENRINFSIGTLLEYVPKIEDRASWWVGGTWNNMAVSTEKWMGQQFGAQVGTKIPLNSPGYFGNRLGHDLDRESALSLAAQYRKQGPLSQLDAGFNYIYSPLLVGLWYRGLGFSETRRDAIIPTVGFMSANVLVQFSYDIPLSSLGRQTNALELTLWYGFGNLFNYKGNGRNAGNFLRY